MSILHPKLKVNEVFESIQGEGAFQGIPVLFIRLSGCTRKCSFCDTKYHNQYKQYSVKALVDKINESDFNVVVWTGGEPLLQLDVIRNVIKQTGNKFHHLETNGDLIETSTDLSTVGKLFHYVCISPKTESVAKRVHNLLITNFIKSDFTLIDVKVVTDGKEFGIDLIQYATMLMPLTVDNQLENVAIQLRVWYLCIEENKRYSARLHKIVGGR